jgi:hypothetical protein
MRNNDQNPTGIFSLAGHLRSLSPEAPERVAYLEKLSDEVQSGRYSVDAHALGREIVEDALGDSALQVLKKGAGAG